MTGAGLPAGARLSRAGDWARFAHRFLAAMLQEIDAAEMDVDEAVVDLVADVGWLADHLLRVADDFGHAEVQRRAAHG